MGATLQETMAEAFKVGKEDIVKRALNRRLRVKKDIRDGKSVSRIDRNNVKSTTNEAVIEALELDREKTGVSRRAEIAKDKARDKAKKKKSTRKPKDVFGIGTAIRDIQKSKGA